MTADRLEVARLWAEALTRTTPDNVAALDPFVADDIETVSVLGTTAGKQDVLATFGRSPIASFFAQGSWSSPEEDGDAVTIACTFPPAAPVGGLSIRLSFDAAGRVARVESTLIQAPPPAATPLDLTAAVAPAIGAALANGTPVVVAYVDRSGRPHLSLRGSTQVIDRDRMAIWVRNPQGGILAAIPDNPNLSLFYRDPATRTTYQVEGRARVDDDAEMRQRVYSGSPETERNLDPRQGGVAVVIDVDRVQGRDASGPVLMERDAG